MPRLTGAVGIAGGALLAALAVTGCATANAASSLSVASAYVPQPTKPGTTVAYLDIRNNGAAVVPDVQVTDGRRAGRRGLLHVRAHHDDP